MVVYTCLPLALTHASMCVGKVAMLSTFCVFSSIFDEYLGADVMVDYLSFVCVCVHIVDIHFPLHVCI